MLESPWNAPNKDCWVWTVDPQEAPDQPEQVTVTVEKGRVVAVNGKALSPYQCPETLNALGAKHGVGRIDIVENPRWASNPAAVMKPRGTIMVAALRAVEQLVLDRDSFKWREQLGRRCPMWCTTAAGSRRCAARCRLLPKRWRKR